MKTTGEVCYLQCFEIWIIVIIIVLLFTLTSYGFLKSLMNTHTVHCVFQRN